MLIKGLVAAAVALAATVALANPASAAPETYCDYEVATPAGEVGVSPGNPAVICHAGGRTSYAEYTVYAGGSYGIITVSVNRYSTDGMGWVVQDSVTVQFAPLVCGHLGRFYVVADVNDDPQGRQGCI